jgi:hypothetical protein
MLKLEIKTTDSLGEQNTYRILPPDWRLWEKEFKSTIQEIGEKLGMDSMLFLAYTVAKRESAGKPVKPFDAWCAGIVEIDIESYSDPKATSQEA